MPNPNSNRLEGIESLRAYAAVAIVCFHLVNAAGARIPEYLGAISTHFGFGVPLFYVVSGFSLAYGYWGKLGDERALGHYFIRRFARIAPLFYFILLFQLTNAWLTHRTTFPPLEILVNATFTFNLIPTMTDGIVYASWTIGVEMIFYTLFPLALMVCRTLSRTVLVLALSIVLATQFSIAVKPLVESLPGFAHHNFIANLPYFVWGMLGFHLHRRIFSLASRRHDRYLCWAICAAAIALLILLYHSEPLYMFFWNRGLRTTWDSLWGIPFGMLCIGMALHPSRVISNAVTRYLGKVSYSLYLVHPTVLFKLAQSGLYLWVYEQFPRHSGYGYLVSFLISLMIITAISSLTFRFIEQPGMNWGKRRSSSGRDVR